jgi:hypothetical protein
MGEMNMGERLVAFGPALAGAPELGEWRGTSLHRSAISRREQRQGARPSSSARLGRPRSSRAIACEDRNSYAGENDLITSSSFLCKPLR